MIQFEIIDQRFSLKKESSKEVCKQRKDFTLVAQLFKNHNLLSKFCPMKKNDRKRAIAENLYINNGESIKSISETVGVSENTISTWSKKYNWKERKMNLAVAPHKIKEALLEQLDSVVKGEKPIFNSDDIAKITRALERVDKKVSTQMVISVMKELDSFLLSIDMDDKLLEKSLDLHKQFIQFRIMKGE